MRAEIICVGTELLLGDIINTNASFLAQELASLGMELYHQSVVGDNKGRLKECLEEAYTRSDLVITSGGLGPTYDDLTKQTVAKFFGKNMKLDENQLKKITLFFQKSGSLMTENNKQQAFIPEGATILENEKGTAPGIYMEDGRRSIIMLPGPPKELEYMFLHQAKPLLLKKTNQILVSHTVHIFGMGESLVENRLHELMIRQQNPTIAPYAKTGEVLLRVTALEETEEKANAMIQPVLAEIKQELGNFIYGIDCENLQSALVQSLKKKGRTVATAESCTGGLISQRITEVPGSSAVFGYGICSYVNAAKENLLGVSPATLSTFGAVSKETAMEMAVGVRKLAGSDIGISTTGIAGPDGGSLEKPVGLVYVGVDSAVYSEVIELHLDRGYQQARETIRYLSASHALNLARIASEKFE